MWIVFLLIVAIYVVGNYYLYNRIRRMLPSGRGVTVGIASLVIVGAVSFFAYQILHDESPYRISKFLLFVSTTWMTFFAYMLMVLLVVSVIGLINRYLPSCSKTTFFSYTQENVVMLSLMFAFVVMLLVGGHFKYLWKTRVEVPVDLRKTLSTDSLSQKKIKVLGLSDMHLGYGIGSDELEDWVQKINAEKPDIVLIAGDLIDNSVKPLAELQMDTILRKIKAPLGVYACLGNHEYIAGKEQSINFLRKTNIRLLVDEVAMVDSAFYVVGRDDRMNPYRLPLKELTANLDHSKPIFLIDHQPADLNETSSCGVDLQLSGHTHAGQVWPATWLVKRMYENPHGYVKKGNSHIYVSSGIGLWGGKFRIGSQSEYVVFEVTGL